MATQKSRRVRRVLGGHAPARKPPIAGIRAVVGAGVVAPAAAGPQTVSADGPRVVARLTAGPSSPILLAGGRDCPGAR
jgi:hypothetical protein